MVAAGHNDVSAVAASFLAWYKSDPPDIGNQTRAVLGGVDDPDDLPAAAAAYLDWKPNNAGNGGLMRTAPVALAALDDRHEVARLAAWKCSHKEATANCERLGKRAVWGHKTASGLEGIGP